MINYIIGALLTYVLIVMYEKYINFIYRTIDL